MLLPARPSLLFRGGMLCKSEYHNFCFGASVGGSFAACGLLIAAPAKCGELSSLSVGAGHWPARILGGPVCRPYEIQGKFSVLP